MFSILRAWKLGAALKARGNAPEAYGAVKELAAIGGPKATALLVGVLARKDGVARSAALALGRLGGEEAAQALARQLNVRELHQSALDALVRMGREAVPVLCRALQDPAESLRRAVAEALGKIRDRQATEPLIQTLSHDDSYAVRVAAAQALGEIQDKRAVWVLVSTLKMRDESSRARQEALEALQETARVALHKLDPMAASTEAATATGLEGQVARLEEELKGESDRHPRLLADPGHLGERELIEVLQELASASEEISWAKHESRAPLLPPYFDSYEKRRETAEWIGRELHRRGGRALLETVLRRDLDNHQTLRNWWDGL